MLYGEIRASFYLGLGEHATKISQFQFGEAVDAAQSWIVNTLPPSLLQELHSTEVVTIYESGAGNAPDGFIKEIALADSSGALFRLMPKINFETFKSIGTYDTIASVSAGGVNVSPAPGEGEDFDLTFLKEPTYYVTVTGETATYADDSGSPDFNASLHYMIIDYAIGTAAAQVGDMNLYQSKMSSVYIAAKGKGAQINMGSQDSR